MTKRAADFSPRGVPAQLAFNRSGPLVVTGNDWEYPRIARGNLAWNRDQRLN